MGIECILCYSGIFTISLLSILMIIAAHKLVEKYI